MYLYNYCKALILKSISIEKKNFALLDMDTHCHQSTIRST